MNEGFGIMKSKVLTKKTIIKKIHEGLSKEDVSIMEIGVNMNNVIEPLIEYIEKETDIEVN